MAPRRAAATCIVMLVASVPMAAFDQAGNVTCRENLLLQKNIMLAPVTAIQDSIDASGNSGIVYIWSGESISLRAHTQKRISVQGEEVYAKFPNQGLWETFVIELKDGDSRAVRMGDTVRFRAHTGQYLETSGTTIDAKAGRHPSAWEEFVVEPSPLPNQCQVPELSDTSRAGCFKQLTEIHVGDSIFLRAHTGNRLAVEGARVHAEWSNQGSWEALVIERVALEVVSDAAYFNCECCDCNEGEGRRPGQCIQQFGQFEVVTDIGSCLEAYKLGQVNLGNHCPPGSHWVGVVSSKWYPAGCFISPARSSDCEWYNIGFNNVSESASRSPCCDKDRRVCRISSQ